MSLLDRIKKLVDHKTRAGPKELAALVATIGDTTARGMRDRLQAQGVDATDEQWLAAFTETQIAFCCFAIAHTVRSTLPRERARDFGGLVIDDLARMPGYIGYAFQDESAVNDGIQCYVNGAPDAQTCSYYESVRFIVRAPETGYHWPYLVAVRLSRILGVEPYSSAFLCVYNACMSAAISAKKNAFNDTLVAAF